MTIKELEKIAEFLKIDPNELDIQSSFGNLLVYRGNNTLFEYDHYGFNDGIGHICPAIIFRKPWKQTKISLNEIMDRN